MTRRLRVEPVGRRVELAPERVGHREHRARPAAATPAARTRSDGAIHSGRPRACTSALATAAPTRRPVKLPGPSLSTMPRTASSVDTRLAQRRRRSSAAARRRAGARRRVSRSTASADEAPSGDRRPVGGGLEREPHQSASSPRRAGSARWCSRNRRVGGGQPGAGPLGPLHQDRVALRQQALPVEIGRLVGRAQPVAVEVEHRPAAALVAVHQRVGRAGGLAARRRGRARWPG